MNLKVLSVINQSNEPPIFVQLPYPTSQARIGPTSEISMGSLDTACEAVTHLCVRKPSISNRLRCISKRMRNTREPFAVTIFGCAVSIP